MSRTDSAGRYLFCKVCGRELKSEKARRRGAGDTCYANSFERVISHREQLHAMEEYHKIRLEELRKKAEAHKKAVMKGKKPVKTGGPGKREDRHELFRIK